MIDPRVDRLAEALKKLEEAEARALEEPTPDNIRRLEYWRTQVKLLRSLLG